MAARVRAKVADIGYDFKAAPKLDVLFCNCCGCEKYNTLATEDRYGFPIESRRCVQCGLIWISPRLTPEGYAEFYAKWYRKLSAVFTNPAASVKAQWRYADCVIPKVTVLANRSGQTCLDAGGSNGIIGAKLRDRWGLKVTVLDPSPSEVAEAQERGLEAECGLIETHDFGGRTFDIVAILQSIEHFQDIAAVFDRVSHELLSPEGLLLVDFVRTVPKLDHCYTLGTYAMSRYILDAGLVNRGVHRFWRHEFFVCERPT